VKKNNRTRSSTDKKDKKVEDLESKFKKLIVTLAKTRPDRRLIPLKRAYVWCSNCGEQGHYPHECLKAYPKVNQVRLEPHIYYTKSQEQVDVEAAPQPLYAPCYAVQLPAQYFPRPLAPSAAANLSKPIYKPRMGPPGGYPPPGIPKEKGVCWNFGAKDHYSPSCPYPYQSIGYIPLCGNYGKEGHLPPEYPEPSKPHTLVRYAQGPTAKPKFELVCLVYTDVGNSETCGTITLVENDISYPEEGVCNV
jgi:hypothetical protein